MAAPAAARTSRTNARRKTGDSTMLYLTGPQATALALQNKFTRISLDRYVLLPMTQDMRTFGFLNQRSQSWWARIAGTEFEWTAFFAAIRRHELTKELSPHQFNDELSTSEPESGHFADVLKQRHAERLARLSASMGTVIHSTLATQGIFSVGSVILHPSYDNTSTRSGYNGYRMKLGNVARSDDSPLAVDWQLLCEFATMWLRDVHVSEHFPWAADPTGVTHSSGSAAFLGTRMLEPFEAAPPSPKLAQVSPSTSTEVKTSAGIEPADFATLAAELLPVVGHFSSDPAFQFLAQVLKPALENALTILGEKGALPRERPTLAEFDSLRESIKLRESELTSQATALEAERKRLEALGGDLKAEIRRLFEEEEQRLIELRARTLAEARALDEAREALRRLLA